MTRHRPVRRLPVLVAAAAALLVAMLAGAPPVSAHGGEGELEVLSVQPAMGGTVDVSVRLSFADDGHHPEQATVTVSGTGPTGVQLTPVTLGRGDGDGVFSGTVELPEPGVWDLRVTAVDPPATVELEDVAVPSAFGPGGDDGTSVPGGPDQPVSDDAPATSTDAAGDDAAAGDRAAGAEADEDGGGFPWAVVLAAVVVVGLLAVGAAAAGRRRSGGGPGAP